MEPRTVTTQGRGTAYAAPDAVVLVLAVDVEGSTPTEALRECGTVQAAVLAALGVTASAGGLSVQPGWDHERQREGRPHAVSTVSARLPDLATAGDVVTAALEAGGRAVRLQSLSPVLTDPGTARARARDAAFAEARTAAEQYALLAGGSLGPLTSLAEGGEGLRMSGDTVMRAAYEVPDGAQDVVIAVVASWELLGD